MTYAIKPAKMQDTHAIRYDIWDLEADEPIVQTFNAQEAQRICDELNKTLEDSSTGEPFPVSHGIATSQFLELGEPMNARNGVHFNFATRKNEVLLASQANLLASSPGRDYLKDEECPLASLPHWQQGMAMALLGRQKAREWAISKLGGPR